MELSNLLVEFIGERPSCHLARVDQLPRELIKFGSFIEGGLQVIRSVCGGVAVVDKRGAEGAGDMTVLSFGPDAHEELYVVQGPGTTLKVSVGPVKLFGVGPVHAYVPLVVLVEIAPDPDNILWAARVQSKAEADVRDEVVEALLPIQRRTGQWESKGPSVFDTKGEGSTDIPDGGLGDRPKAGGVGPPLAPGCKAPVGGGFPGVHPDRQHRQQSLVGGEFSSAFA